MITRSMRGAAFAGLLAMLVLGCSDSNDGGDAGTPTADDFISEASALICADVGDCCERDGNAFSAARCRANYTTTLESHLARGTVTYDAAAGGRCIEAFRASPGQCDGTPAEVADCDGVFRGTLPEGAACTDGIECAGFPESALCLDQDSDSTGPVCTPIRRAQPVRAARGESCTGTCRPVDGVEGCIFSGTYPPVLCFIEDGLYCAGATSTCEPLIAEGGACAREPDFPGCVPGALCEHERCVPVRGEGESCLVDICTTPLECPSPSAFACGPGLRCASAEPVPLCIVPQPDGSTCRSPAECASGWCEFPCNDQESCTGSCGPPRRTTPEQCLSGFAESADAKSDPLFLRTR
jgi:hypothetical protein